MKFLIVVENAGSNYSAYSPDIPGCFATGATIEEAEGEMLNAIHNYLDDLAESGGSPPHPTTAAASFVHVEDSRDAGHAA